MVRFFWNPNTGLLDSRKTVKSIKRSFGDIDFFVSKNFAKAFKIEEAIGDEPQKFVGSVPEVGWSKADAKEAIRPLLEHWTIIRKIDKPSEILEEDLTAFEFNSYLETIKDLKDLREELEISDDLIAEVEVGDFWTGFVKDNKSEAFIYADGNRLTKSQVQNIFEDVAASFDHNDATFDLKTVEFDPGARKPNPALIVIRTNHGVYVYNAVGDRLEKTHSFDIGDFIDLDPDEVFPNQPDLGTPRGSS